MFSAQSLGKWKPFSRNSWMPCKNPNGRKDYDGKTTTSATLSVVVCNNSEEREKMNSNFPSVLTAHPSMKTENGWKRMWNPAQNPPTQKPTKMRITSQIMLQRMFPPSPPAPPLPLPAMFSRSSPVASNSENGNKQPKKKKRSSRKEKKINLTMPRA